MESLKRYRLTYVKIEIEFTGVENKHCYQGLREVDINGKIWIDIYTLLYIELITNKDLLCSTGNSAQYSVMDCMEKESKKEWVYVTDFL